MEYSEHLPGHETIDLDDRRKSSMCSSHSTSSSSDDGSQGDPTVDTSKVKSVINQKKLFLFQIAERPICESTVKSYGPWVRLLTECIAEFFGMTILILFGCSSIAQYTLSRGALSSFLSVNFAFGFGSMIAVYIAGPISGAHLNPAVSIAMLSLRSITPIQCLTYIISREFMNEFTRIDKAFFLRSRISRRIHRSSMCIWNVLRCNQSI